MVLDGRDGEFRKTNPMFGSFNGTGGGLGLSSTAMEKMAAGAIQAAIGAAFGETSPGHSAELDEDGDIIEDEDADAAVDLAALAAVEKERAARLTDEQGEKQCEKQSEKEKEKECTEGATDETHQAPSSSMASPSQANNEDDANGESDGEGRGTDPNLSMSLMSICDPRSPPPRKVRAPLSPHAESPSIIVLEDDEPLWTNHKPLPKPSPPKPMTPPRSARKEKPVLLGIPQPLSARGAARCDANGAPLSARYHRPRPGNRRGKQSTKTAQSSAVATKSSWSVTRFGMNQNL